MSCAVAAPVMSCWQLGGGGIGLLTCISMPRLEGWPEGILAECNCDRGIQTHNKYIMAHCIHLEDSFISGVKTSSNNYRQALPSV